MWQLSSCTPEKRDFNGRSNKIDGRKTFRGVFLASPHVPFDKQSWFPPGNISAAQTLLG